MDKNGKSRHSVWLSDEVWQEVDAFYTTHPWDSHLQTAIYRSTRLKHQRSSVFLQSI